MSKRNYENFEEKDEASLLESGSHSDFTIICKGSEWKVHKNIISLRSNYFATLFENDFVEGREEKINLEGDDPLALKQMLDYLYTKAFDCGQDVDDQDEPSIIKQMLEILAVYVLGDKYDIPGLRKYCRTLFEELESKAQSSYISFVRYHAGNVAITEPTIPTIGLLNAVAEALASIPPNDQELLEDIIQFCAANIRYIFRPIPGYETYHTSLEWNNIFHEHAVFTTRLLQAVTAQSLNKAESDEKRIISLAAENQALVKTTSDLELEIKNTQTDLDTQRRIHWESMTWNSGGTEGPTIGPYRFPSRAADT